MHTADPPLPASASVLLELVLAVAVGVAIGFVVEIVEVDAAVVESRPVVSPDPSGLAREAFGLGGSTLCDA